MATHAQAGERLPRRDGEGIVEQADRHPDRFAITSRIGDDQEDMVEATVAELQHDPAHLVLRVDHPRLALDGKDRAAIRSVPQSADRPIEGPLIAEDGQRHLQAHR